MVLQNLPLVIFFFGSTELSPFLYIKNTLLSLELPCFLGFASLFLFLKNINRQLWAHGLAADTHLPHDPVQLVHPTYAERNESK